MSIVLKDGTVLPDLPEGAYDGRRYGYIYSTSFVYMAITASAEGLFIPGKLTNEPWDNIYFIADSIMRYEYNDETGSWGTGNAISNVCAAPIINTEQLTSVPMWSNHDIYPVTSMDENGITIGTEIYFPSSVSKPPFVLPDGTELPALPDGCFDGTPYGMILLMEGVYYLFATASSVFAETYLGSEDYSWYPVYPSGKAGMWMASDGKWELVADVAYDTPTEGPPIDLYPICWVNHDILFATKNDDGSYTIGTEIARKSDENYRVTGGYMTSIANEARRLGGKTGGMLPAVMESTLRAATAGFMPPANAILVYIGTAESNLSVGSLFSSNAIGSLTE